MVIFVTSETFEENCYLMSVPDEEQAQRLAELFPHFIYFFADVTTEFI